MRLPLNHRRQTDCRQAGSRSFPAALLVACLTIWLASVCGCTLRSDGPLDMSKLTGDDAEKKPAPGPIQVRVDSFGKPLREGQENTIARDQFLARIDQFLKEERFASARLWIQRHPDVALETLRATPAGEANRPAVVAVARAYDKLVGLAPAEGWQAVLHDRTARPKTYAEYDKARKSLLEQLRLGQIREATATKITRLAAAAPGDMLDVDAWQLRAIAWQLDQRPQEAVAAMKTALEHAAKDAYQVAQLRLLLSEALRRSGQPGEANTTWQEAVAEIALLAGKDPAILDPNQWNHAAYLRPADRPWPDVVSALLEPSRVGEAPLEGSPRRVIQDPELLVWTLVGQAHLERGENQAALVALKRAETAAQDARTRNLLRLAEAKALCRMDQTTAATAILVSLSNSKDPQLARPALAMLGTQKLQLDDSEAGLKLLTKAMENADALDWADRAQAEADFGLVLLMSSDEAGGLQWLHRAQRRFEGSRDHESLAKSLWNEASYFKHKGRKEAAEIERRLHELERE